MSSSRKDKATSTVQAKQQTKPSEPESKNALALLILGIAIVLSVYAFDFKSAIHNLVATKHSRPVRNDHYLLRDIWSEGDIEELLGYVKKIGTYSTTASDLTSSAEHIGEAVPFDEKKGCPFLLVPNMERTLCILPSRIDVAQHYLKYGGRDNLKETYSTLSSRLQAFSGFIFESLEAPVLKSLFESEQYITAATASCGGLSTFDPIQLGIIILLPGQTVAMHLDVPWFWGATRFNIPQWLLIAMESSGLFEDVRVRQSQGVAYLHQWLKPEYDSGGFYFYPNGTEGAAEVVPAEFNTGLVLDGSVIMHGVETYRPASKPPRIAPSDKNELVYVGDDRWHLNGNGGVKAVYKTTDLRVSLVWRARCFESEDEKKKWASYTEKIAVEHILSVLTDDMRRKGVMGEEVLTPLDLALNIVNEYIAYPVEPKSLIPVNYCMLDRVVPKFLSPVLSNILSWVCD